MSTLVKYLLIAKIAMLLLTAAPSQTPSIFLVDGTPPAGTNSDEDSPDVGSLPWDTDQQRTA